MNKKDLNPLTVFGFFILAIVIFVISSLIAVAHLGEYVGIICSIVLMIAAIPVHILGKKNNRFYLLSFLLNSVANGLSVSTYYLVKNKELELPDMLCAAVPATLILFVVYAVLSLFGKSKKITLIIAGIINVALSVTLAFLWIFYGYALWSFAFFCSMISFFYLLVFAFTVGHNERSTLRDISFGSFGAFIVISLVVIFILSEGDIIDGLDLGFEGKANKKRK